ncbi:hypothetical protein IM45_688 [Candidatus Palibaumannia cicadellinicola]|uniref:Uncharacterized protein n=1 Tax=Candidatus Palibaumannia cicadellinicola TaxID=186490 RepID=A0A088NAR8_9GAMM|nr:hypothetical protein IM45_688 [Candidatus Baumannia cicadellinicola]
MLVCHKFILLLGIVIVNWLQISQSAYIYADETDTFC